MKSDSMKMLVCTGGSKYAENAIKVGGEIAKGLSADVTLLSVIEGDDKARAESAIKSGKSILQSIGLTASEIIREGDPASEILKEGRRGDYDMIVMGSHGLKGIKEFLIGGTARKVVEYSRRSVLIVRGEKAISRILICISVSKYCGEVIEFGGMIAKATDSEVTVLNVIPVPMMYAHVESDIEFKELMKANPMRARYLQEAAKTLRRVGWEAEIKLREGFPEEEILKEATEGNFDLIMLGSHSWTGVSHLLIPSLSYTIVKHAKNSVLIVKPKSLQTA